MRYFLLFVTVLYTCAGMRAQSDSNPFELRRPVAADTLTTVAPVLAQEGATGGYLIFVHLFLVVFLASLWVLFRALLRQCIGAVFNDSVMTQLYRRRSEGQVQALWLAYLYFLLIAGLFLYLTARYLEVDQGWGVLAGWGFATLVLAATLGLKLFVLMLVGQIYGLRREVSRYTFVLMVFSIVAGLFLFPLNLLITYAPPSWTPVALVGGAALLVLTYLLHLLRGTFIANRYLSGRPLHFLLYLCTIEIAPILLVYRYLSTSV